MTEPSAPAGLISSRRVPAPRPSHILPSPLPHPFAGSFLFSPFAPSLVHLPPSSQLRRRPHPLFTRCVPSLSSVLPGTSPPPPALSDFAFPSRGPALEPPPPALVLVRRLPSYPPSCTHPSPTAAFLRCSLSLSSAPSPPQDPISRPFLSPFLSYPFPSCAFPVPFLQFHSQLYVLGVFVHFASKLPSHFSLDFSFFGLLSLLLSLFVRFEVVWEFGKACQAIRMGAHLFCIPSVSPVLP